MWCAWIGHPSENFRLFGFLESFRCSISSISMYYAPEWKVITIWISWELPLFNYERLDISCAWIGPPCEKFWPFWISGELPLFNFERLEIWCAWIGPPCEKLWPFEFHESFCCSISSISICDAPESDIRVNSFDHLNFLRTSVIEFRATPCVMCLNRITMW